MEIKELIKLIDLPKEISKEIEKFLKLNNPMQYKEVIDELVNEEASLTTFNEINNLFKDDYQNIGMLTLYLFASLKTYDKYVEKKINKNIFVDTMKCFSRFLFESKEKYGEYIFDRGWWTFRQTKMSLFRIGELEYEFLKNGDEKKISIHIPSDAKFTEIEINKSLEECLGFVKKYYPEYENTQFICDSWLLSPKLKSLLPNDSNILKFQRRFEIISVDENEKDFIEWIFQKEIDTPIDELIAKTSLQKKVIELLKNNQSIGSAYGILKKHY